MKPPVNINVVTCLIDSDDPETEREINHADPLHRQWLEKHTFWAMRNGRSVTLEPVEVNE